MRTTLRDRIAAADPAQGTAPYPPHMIEQAISAITTEHPAPGSRRRGWRSRGVVAGICVALGAGATASIATLVPADKIATPPLSSPTILNGSGPEDVVLPDPPEGALYVHFELACYDTTYCGTPLGAMASDSPSALVDRGSFPLTSWTDPMDVADKPTLVPSEGLPITVEVGTHWRLYAIYTDRLELDAATLEDGRTLGVPSFSLMPDLMPAETTTGESGWIDYEQFTTGAAPRPGDVGPRPDPLPVYDADGHTVIGTAEVDATYP
ncbi:hypothetical protein [Ornithinimicrobium faecis]|uniref:hypothetical protein n=1 Tax=Ornithinimicrobium faecis TaxID=2934158 RepID=UPI002119B67B|nr:hypothetical protein [Ornithinimicrobium sp. HY1745]